LSCRSLQSAPDITVCIVNWNCRERLRACLKSLQAVEEVTVEIVVVDNGSTDGAAEMVAEDFPEVHLIRNRANEGFARANNQAARHGTGRYLFFLNNDTVVPPGALRRLLEYAGSHPETGFLGPRLRDGRGRAQISWRLRPSVPVLLHRLCLLRWTGLFRRAYRRYRARDGDFEATRPVEVLMGAALLMPRKVYEECGPWDEDYTFGGEDIDLCTRVGQKYQVVYHPEVEITHFGRESSRLHIGYAHTHTVIGITRFLRKNGCSPLLLLGYKIALTLDVPVQWLCQAGQYLWRRMRGQHTKAAKSYLVLRGLGYFLTRGLPAFWQA
jgi:GT2 family glycosyltransferase